MIRTFTGQIQEREVLPTLPTWTPSDISRVVYVVDVNKWYNATNAAWVEVGSVSGIEAQDTGHVLTTADSGKTFTCNSAVSRTFNLPSVAAADIGIEFTFIKLGVGELIIDAADSDTIEDSGAGLTIYCKDVTTASIGLKLVTATQWMIKYGATGIWRTTTT